MAEADGEVDTVGSLRSAATAAPGSSARALSGALALLALCFLVYFPALNGEFIWDDDYFVSENPTLRTLAGLKQIWTDPVVRLQYYPLVHTSFWIEYQLWGLNTLGYHLVNVGLHALNAWLLWRVLMALRVPGAAFAAAVFLLHPVHVESVAWITERKNVLSGCFYLLAMLAWLRFDPLSDERQEEKRSWGWYGLALLLYLAALLSKSVTCSFPAVILLVIWWKRGRIAMRETLPLVPLFLVGIGLGLLTVWMERKFVGAEGGEFSLAPAERILVAGRALWFYAEKLVWPNPLVFVYPRWPLDTSSLLQWAFPLTALAAICGLFLLRHRIGRGPLAAVLCFSGTLLPALGFFNVYPHRFSFVADHFQYLASAFLIAAFAAVLARLMRPRVMLVFSVMSLLALAGQTWRQAHVYQGLEALWADTLAKNPSAWLAHFNYANLLTTRGERDRAIQHFEAAIAFNPNYWEAMSNLAGTLQQDGRLAESESWHHRALQLQPRNARMHFNLGVLCQAHNREDEAYEHFQAALRLDQMFTEARVNLANILLRRGDVNGAVQQYERSLTLDPSNARLLNNYGTALAAQGKLDEATRQFVRAAELDPGYADAAANVGISLWISGKAPEAAEKLQQALKLDPDHAAANYRFAELLAANNHSESAARHYRRALKQRPDWPEALGRLAVLLAISVDPKVADAAQALKLSQRALELAGRSVWLLDVHAIALAANGEFDLAVKTADEAERLAREQGRNEMAAQIAGRKQLYTERRPYKEVPRQR